MRIVLTRNGAKIIKELEFEDVPKRRNRTNDSINISSSITEETNPFQNLNKKESNYTEISLKERKLKIPYEIEEKYNKSNTNNSIDSNKQVIPDILYDINKSMELDNRNNSSNSKLPIIRNSYPIKYIINPLSYKKLEKDVKNKISLIKKGKKLTEDNFRSHVYEDPKKIFDKNNSFEIHAENRNLIMYLNNDETISNSYIAKLNKYNNEKIKKLNKICQSAFFYKKQGESINNYIKQKLKNDVIQVNDYYKNKLKQMKKDLDESKKYFKFGMHKFNKRERYINQIRKAEKDWVTFNITRLYKRSDPPKTNIYVHPDEDNIMEINNESNVSKVLNKNEKI